MRKLFTKLAAAIAVLGLFNSGITNAQTAQPGHCGSHLYYKDLYSQNPGLQEKDDAYEAALSAYLKAQDPAELEKKRRSGEIVIPLVFHVIHDYGAEHIADENIYDAVRILNEDYNKIIDTNKIVPYYRPKIGNAKITFKLAHKDPDGNCTNGINRINSYKTRKAGDDSKLEAWSRNYYFNIWIIRDFSRPGVAAYAYKPQSLTGGGNLNFYDGIICNHNQLGSLSPSNKNVDGTLTHELGHSLGLDHPWGGTNEPEVACGDDGVADTAPTEGHLTCGTQQLLYDTVCYIKGDTSNGTVGIEGPLENLQNFMDYSYCPDEMFTEGQVNRMRDVSFVQNQASRGLLNTQLAWDISGIYDTTVCPPKPDFFIRKYWTVLNRNNVTSSNYTTNTKTGTTYSWAIPNSTANGLTTPTFTNIAFNTTGWQPIALTVTSSNGASTLAKNTRVYVADPADALQLNQSEDFDNTTNTNKFPLFNLYDNYFRWQVAPGGYLGNALKMNTYDDRPVAQRIVGTPGGDQDEFVTMAFDLSGCNSACKLQFASSGATITSNFGDVNDSLSLFYTKDDGDTWTKLGGLNAKGTYGGGVSGGILFNKLQVTTNYQPSGYGDYVWRTVDLPANAFSNKTFFRFVYNAGNFSNNLYIDNIGVSNYATGLTSNDGSVNLSVFPNPNGGNFTVQAFGINDAEVQITDVTGKIVNVKAVKVLGSNKVEFNLYTSLPSGVYFANVLSKGSRVATQKFVVSQ
jgi:hypothetical protein